MTSHTETVTPQETVATTQGTGSILVAVTSQGGLRIEPYEQTVRLGLTSTAQFECIHPLEGSRKIGYTWSRADNKPLPAFAWPNGRYLIFNGISDAAAGKYLCTIRTVDHIDHLGADLFVTDDEGAFVRA